MGEKDRVAKPKMAVSCCSVPCEPLLTKTLTDSWPDKSYAATFHSVGLRYYQHRNQLVEAAEISVTIKSEIVQQEDKRGQI